MSKATRQFEVDVQTSAGGSGGGFKRIESFDSPQALLERCLDFLAAVPPSFLHWQITVRLWDGKHGHHGYVFRAGDDPEWVDECCGDLFFTAGVLEGKP